MISFCAHCGARLEQESRFCDACGAAVVQPANPCPSCATPNAASASFCQGCGTPLRESVGAGAGSGSPPKPAEATDDEPKAKAPRPLATPESFEGLYHFVRSHLLIVNSLVGFASTSVALLDFLSPRVSLLPRVIYTGTAMLAAALLAAAVLPRVDRWLLGWLFRSPHPQLRVWRQGAWQFAVLLLALVSGFGFESVAKAGQGGVLASAIPGVRALQARLLSIDTRLGEVGIGVSQANRKLDRIQSEINPDNPADRCADLDCAIRGGASEKAMARLFAKGQSLPGSPLGDAIVLWEAVYTPNAQQNQVVDLLLRHGADAQAPLPLTLTDARMLTSAAQRNSQAIYDKAQLSRYDMADPMAGDYGPLLAVWNAVAGCLIHTQGGGPTLIEAAALMGDVRLVAHLRAQGLRFPSRPLVCAWSGMLGSHGEVRLRLDPESGRIASMRGGASFPVPIPALPAQGGAVVPPQPYRPATAPMPRS